MLLTYTIKLKTYTTPITIYAREINSSPSLFTLQYNNGQTVSFFRHKIEYVTADYNKKNRKEDK